MALLSVNELRVAEAIGRIGYSNPFLPERLELERTALGDEFSYFDNVISLPLGADVSSLFPNLSKLLEKAKWFADRMRSGLMEGRKATRREQQVYRRIVLYHLYGQQMTYFDGLVARKYPKEKPKQLPTVWRQFRKDFEHFFKIAGLDLPPHYEPSHLFAIFLQIHRAFSCIFECIIGRSMPIARLRAAVWESVFTCDMERYERLVYRTIGQIPTLITGPSGTGKELVARAIGLSRYLPFDTNSERFELEADSTLYAVNLSALSPTLIESELFGHRKGAFTGADQERAGWFEVAGPQGAVFLDEIGELEHSVQVKLLRVLQSRSFSRVGESSLRSFVGKFVAATNRDLSLEIASGKFREDLYYRLCADMIRTPTLREQIGNRPADLQDLVEFISRRLLGGEVDEASLLATEAVAWIQENLGENYGWPGNIRELEQCVSSLLIRRSYQPVVSRNDCDREARFQFASAVSKGSMTIAELNEHYISMVYAEEQRYDLAAKRLGIDWRTLKQKVNTELVEKYSMEQAKHSAR